MGISTNKLVCNIKGHQDLSYRLFNNSPALMITCKECGQIFVVEDRDHINEIAPYFDINIFKRLKERMELW